MSDIRKNGNFNSLVDRAIARATTTARVRDTAAVATSWMADYDRSSNRLYVWHYSTLMLIADRYHDKSGHELWVILDWSLGWGSATDQQGMNRLFDRLGYPDLSYRRDQAGGGPRIEQRVLSLAVTPTVVKVDDPLQLRHRS